MITDKGCTNHTHASCVGSHGLLVAHIHLSSVSRIKVARRGIFALSNITLGKVFHHRSGVKTLRYYTY